MKKKSQKSSKSMNLFDATSIGVGAMIGAGIFALIGIAVDIAGELAYLSFVIGGVIALFTSYSVAKLSVAFPRKGGRVEFLNKGFGAGILSGSLNLIMWIGYIIVTSLYAKAFGEYGVALLGLKESGPWLHILISSIVVLFLIINFIGASVVGKSELIIVAVKVIVLLGFGLLGLFTVEAEQFTISKNIDFSNVLLAGGVVFMSYEGFGLIANTAEDVRQPKKNLPRALYISVSLVIIIYLLVSITVIGNLSINEILSAKEYVLAEAAKPIMGSIGFTIMGIAALFSTASAINATIYGPVHMIQETSKYGQVPKFLSASLLKHESGVALLISGILILLISNLLDIEAIAETGSMIFLLIYTTVNISNYRLKTITGSSSIPIWIGILGTSFCFIFLFYFVSIKSSITIYVFLTILVAGFLFEYLFLKHIKKERIKFIYSDIQMLNKK